MKKPFNETGIGKFLKEKVKPMVGNALDFVGEITGKEGIERIGEFLNNKKEESPEHAALAFEFEKYKMDWEMELMQIELEAFKLEVQDKDSARNREIEFMRANRGKRDWLMGVSVIIGLVMYVCAFLFLAYGPIVPDGKKDLFNMGVGQVFTFAGMVFSFYLGSTKSSRVKDETIRKISDK